MTTPDPLSFDEFDAVGYAQWVAAVEAHTPLSALTSRVDVTGASHLNTDPAYAAGERRAPVRRESAPWTVGQEYRLADPAEVARAVAVDRRFGLGAAWVRVRPGGPAMGRPAGDGVVLATAQQAGLLAQAVGDAALWLDAGMDGPKVASLLLDGVRAKTALRGGVLCDPLGARAQGECAPDAVEDALVQTGELVARLRSEAPALRVLLCSGIPYHDAGAAPSVELGATIATLIDVVRTLGEAGLAANVAVNDLWPRTVLRLAADCDVFVGLAKVRALRWLGERVVARWGLEFPAFVSVRTSWRDRTRHDPWVNMLRTTTEVFSAVTGGADEVAAQPFSEALGAGDDNARRWALNTAHMLREESHAAHVVDPGGGSGYVESLTTALAERAWDWVQGVEAAGGMAAALRSGTVQADVRRCAAARAHALAVGRLALTGVSIFPQLDEPPVPVVEQPRSDARGGAQSAVGLQASRLAEPFEALRDAAQRHLDSTRARPRAQLLARGPRGDHRSRLDFARSFVRVGGLEAEVVDEVADVSSKLVVVVASDARLAADGRATIDALRRAGASCVWVAGPSREDLGADGFLSPGADVLRTLAAFHNALEVGA